MPKIGLVADNICSLSEEIINRYKIEIVNTKLSFSEAEKFPEKNLYQLMKKTKVVPKTSSPSPGDYLRSYKKSLESFDEVLVVSLSSKLSVTYNVALQAKKMMPEPSRISVFDSLSAVAVEGLLTEKAGELIQQGKNLNEVLGSLTFLRKKSKLFGFLKTTYWIEKIGRMNHWQATAFKFLKSFGAQPYVGLKEGKVDLTGFNFWTRDTFKALFNQIKNEAKKTKIQLAINYTDNFHLAHALKEKVENDLNVKVKFISLVPPIVGANSGPGTLIAGCLPII